ncbi:MAG TPA: 3-hydroxyacyl-CoA dehydrogenase NAD-binding domain-containing protein [Planctomycetota bacterium]|jgi:3-hydroxybutyryl-CoA dehydrogenase
MPNSTIAVIGAGTMGAGIAQVAASCGLDVLLIDTAHETLRHAIDRISHSLQRMVKKGVLPDGEADHIPRRINSGTELSAARNADFVIEAVFEDESVKRQLWERLDTICLPEAFFATNTSSISITQLASATRVPERFIGLHFFNPVPVMKLVEVIRGCRTSQATTDAALELVKKLQKTPVEVHDYPGFVSNRVLMPMINEAIFAVYEGVATPQAVDEIFRLGMAHPMGPLALADLIGLDVCLNIMEVLQRGFGDPKYRPCPLLRQMVAAKKLGQKTGEGFHKY